MKMTLTKEGWDFLENDTWITAGNSHFTYMCVGVNSVVCYKQNKNSYQEVSDE